MNKSNFFTGQPIFSQLLSFVSKADIARIVKEYQSDHYIKRFKTWNHLVTMLFGVYQNCTSLRELTTGMMACEGKLQSLGLTYFSKRSTLSDANKNRSHEVFQMIYYKTYDRLKEFLPDSRLKSKVNKLFIVDSTTITLFQEIFTGAGTPPQNGRKKGGVKVHMAVQGHQDVPCFVNITNASTNDNVFLKHQQFPVGSYVVFDKGYNGFEALLRFMKEKVNWVTRLRNNTIVEVVKSNQITAKEKQLGVRKDQIVVIGNNKLKQKVACRLITFWDHVNGREFKFITNNIKVLSSTIAEIYKRRWQIELLFKRLKQNLLQQYFLGDNQNAIKIQIWISLIADLLLRVSTNGLKRRWAYSNLAGLIRMHLMHYTNLKRFLENPEKAGIYDPIILRNNQLIFNLSTDG